MLAKGGSVCCQHRRGRETHICQMSSGLIKRSVCLLAIDLSGYSLSVEGGIVNLEGVAPDVSTGYSVKPANQNLRPCCRHRLPRRPVGTVSAHVSHQLEWEIGRHTVMPISISSHWLMGAILLRYETHVLTFSSTGSSNVIISASSRTAKCTGRVGTRGQGGEQQHSRIRMTYQTAIVSIGTRSSREKTGAGKTYQVDHVRGVEGNAILLEKLLVLVKHAIEPGEKLLCAVVRVDWCGPSVINDSRGRAVAGWQQCTYGRRARHTGERRNGCSGQRRWHRQQTPPASRRCS